MTPFWHVHTKTKENRNAYSLTAYLTAELSLDPRALPREPSEKRKHWGRDCYGELTRNEKSRADKGWAVKRARPSKKV